jgi:hypothetical protein
MTHQRNFFCADAFKFWRVISCKGIARETEFQTRPPRATIRLRSGALSVPALALWQRRASAGQAALSSSPVIGRVVSARRRKNAWCGTTELSTFSSTAFFPWKGNANSLRFFGVDGTTDSLFLNR